MDRSARDRVGRGSKIGRTRVVRAGDVAARRRGNREVERLDRADPGTLEDLVCELGVVGPNHERERLGHCAGAGSGIPNLRRELIARRGVDRRVDAVDNHEGGVALERVAQLGGRLAHLVQERDANL